MVVNPFLPGDLTVADLNFDHNTPANENAFFAALEEAISDALYLAAFDAVAGLWSPLNVYIVINDGEINLEGFGLVLGTDRFSGTFEVVGNVVNPSWAGAIPPLSVGAITFDGEEISVVVTENLTLVFGRVE